MEKIALARSGVRSSIAAALTCGNTGAGSFVGDQRTHTNSDELCPFGVDTVIASAGVSTLFLQSLSECTHCHRVDSGSLLLTTPGR